ncbi:MAG: regulatory protein RecX [Herpetosiphonaceae bacterium]|nr:MAG: regulatory protein RecX [Herpetosiphonaceae bacterium]
MASGTITALQVQERDKERVNVFIDGAFAIGVSLRTVQAAGLYKGKRIDEAEFAALQELEQADKAYEAALRFLEARPRSEREVRARLQRRGFPDDHIEAALERLRSLGLVDDSAFARFWVENRQAHRPRGVQALRQELRQKGVDDELIAETLETWSNIDDEQARALSLGRAALRRYAGSDQTAFFPPHGRLSATPRLQL